MLIVCLDSIHAVRRKTRRSLSESGGSIHSALVNEEDTLKGMVEAVAPSERMHQELDEASKMMSMLTESLDTDFAAKRRLDEAEGQKAGPGREGSSDAIKRRSRTLSSKLGNRLGVASSTLSTSEPGMFVRVCACM